MTSLPKSICGMLHVVQTVPDESPWYLLRTPFRGFTYPPFPSLHKGTFGRLGAGSANGLCVSQS